MKPLIRQLLLLGGGLIVLHVALVAGTFLLYPPLHVLDAFDPQGTIYRQARRMVAFGVWDILYYVWLKVISGWPRRPSQRPSLGPTRNEPGPARQLAGPGHAGRAARGNKLLLCGAGIPATPGCRAEAL